MGSSAFAFIIVASFGFLLVSADRTGCQTEADCGTGGNCHDGLCQCKKDYTAVNDKPVCQRTAHVGESCKHSEQCTEVSGILSRCNKGKCECYDTEKNGMDQVWEYKKTCYRATDLGGDCSTNDQCMASIHPPENVRCERNHEGSNIGKCKCEEGKKCEERSGAIGVHASVATIGLVIFTAMKVVL